MSDPVVFILFSNPQVFRVGLALVGFDQTALSIFWSLDRGCKAQFIFSIMAIRLCTFVFIRMDIMYLTLIYGFGVTKHVLLSAEMK